MTRSCFPRDRHAFTGASRSRGKASSNCRLITFWDWVECYGLIAAYCTRRAARNAVCYSIYYIQIPLWRCASNTTCSHVFYPALRRCLRPWKSTWRKTCGNDVLVGETASSIHGWQLHRRQCLQQLLLLELAVLLFQEPYQPLLEKSTTCGVKAYPVELLASVKLNLQRQTFCVMITVDLKPLNCSDIQDKFQFAQHANLCEGHILLGCNSFIKMQHPKLTRTLILMSFGRQDWDSRSWWEVLELFSLEWNGLQWSSRSP